MQKFTLLLLVNAFILLFTTPSFAQEANQLMWQQNKAADVVIEGEVESQDVYRGELPGIYFTRHKIKINHTFKGEYRTGEYLYVRTQGGQDETGGSTVHHTVQLHQGEQGIFMLQKISDLHSPFKMLGGAAGKIQHISGDHAKEGYYPATREKIRSWRLLREKIGLWNGQDLSIPPLTADEEVYAQAGKTEFCLVATNPKVSFATNQISFDLEVKANIAGLLFAGANIVMDYPDNNLGQYLATNGNVKVERLDVIADAAYFVKVADLSKNTLQLKIQAQCHANNKFYTLNNNYEKLARITVNVKDWGAPGTIEFEKFLTNGNAWRHVDGNTCKPFDDLCVDAQVGLTSCEVTSVEMAPHTAGTGMLMTINGTNFGNGIGAEIRAPNANNDGDTDLIISGLDVVLSDDQSWGEDQIRILLPSNNSYFDGTGINNAPVGSGTWTINPDVTQGGTVNCFTTIEVDFAVSNTEEQEFIALVRNPFDIADGAFEWYLDSDIRTDPALMSQGITFDDVLKVASQVACDWESATGLDFRYMGEIANATAMSDDKTIIMFDNLADANGVVTTVGVTTNYISVINCDEVGGYVLESDIVMDNNNNTKWYVAIEEDDIEADELDFYSVLTHEFGHALLQEHAMDTDQSNMTNDPRLMYWMLDQDQIKRDIDPNANAGSNFVINRSESAIEPGECLAGFALSDTPMGCIVPVHEVGTTTCSNTLRQNILHPGTDIVLESENSQIKGYRLVSASGQLIQLIQHTHRQDSNVHIATDRLSPGIYFLQYQCEEGLNTHRIVVQ